MQPGMNIGPCDPHTTVAIGIVLPHERHVVTIDRDRSDRRKFVMG
jgi:hypothetical protein